MAEQLPWKVQLLEARLRKVIGKQIGRLKKAASGAALPGVPPKGPRPRPLAGWPSWDKVGRAMVEGRPLPSRLIDPGAQGGVPASTIRAADHLLARMAVDKEKKAETPRTRWAFLPSRGQIVVVKIAGERVFGKVLDWGTGGMTVATKDGEVYAAWADVRPARERELAEARRREDDDQENAGRVTSKFGHEDLVVGLTVTAIEGDHAGGGTEHTGRIVSTHPGAGKGGHLVIEEPSGALWAARYYDVVAVAGPEPVAKSWSVDILDDVPDEVDG